MLGGHPAVVKLHEVSGVCPTVQCGIVATLSGAIVHGQVKESPDRVYLIMEFVAGQDMLGYILEQAKRVRAAAAADGAAVAETARRGAFTVAVSGFLVLMQFCLCRHI